MNKFSKVSFEQFVIGADMTKCYIPNKKRYESYYDLKLPKRSTVGSAGYDFFAPFRIVIPPQSSVIVPTGIRCELDSDKCLLLVPRSGLGFKYRLQLANTIGVIDSDYYYSDNEGHIMAKLSNDIYGNADIVIEQGKAFMQGMIFSFCKTDDDCTDGIRNGGFGSTDKGV